MSVITILAPNGEEIYIQYREAEDSDLPTATANLGQIIRDVGERTEILKKNVVNTIGGYSEILLDCIKRGMAGCRPDNVSLEFGLQLGGKAGIPFITEGTAQANVKVSLEWNMKEDVYVRYESE